MKNFKDKIRTSVKMSKQSSFGILALIVIVAVAVLIRMSPIFRGPAIIKAFDPWVQYDNTLYLVENGLTEFLQWHDTTMWYPEGKPRYLIRPGLSFTSAGLYYLLNFLGIEVTVYQTCYFFPAVMGGLTVLAMYFLGREILDHRMGLLAAFFLAFSPGHMQRTTVGFYDNETVGVFAVIMVLFFYIKAIKTGKPVHAVLGGIFLGYLSMSWGSVTYVMLLIPLTSLIMILAGKYSDRLFISTTGVLGVGLLITTISSHFPLITYGGFFMDMDYVIPALFLGFMVIYHFFDRQKTERPEFYDKVWTFIKWAIIPIIIVAAILLWGFPDVLPFELPARFTAILDPTRREEHHIVASVGEHMPSPWSVFYYNTLIPLILVPIGIYFCFRRLAEEDVIIMVFLLTLFYFTGSMIRIVLLFAPAAALVGSYGLVMILKHYGALTKKDKVIRSRRRKRQVKKTMGTQEAVVVFVFVGILMIAQVNHAATVSIEQMSWSELVAGGQFHDWEESLTWMRNNLPGTAVVASWWDYGYWMNVIGNVTTLNDNGTDNNTRIGLMGMAMMQTDEIESAKIFRMLGAEYVLVYWGHLLNQLGGDEGKWPWMLRICNDHTEGYRQMGLEAYNWETHNGKNMVFDEDKYINGSSGQYEDLWFQSQLVRLMLYDEPTSLSSVTQNDQLDYYYARTIGGDGDQYQPREDDNGRTWASHIPTDGQYEFKVFREAFFSTNTLVKIYRIDYTALESEMIARNATLRDDGFGSVVVENTGSKNVNIKNVTVTGKDLSTGGSFTFDNSPSSTGNITQAIEGGNSLLQPGQSKTIWFHLNSTTLQLAPDDEYQVDVSVEAPAIEDNTYEFSNNTSTLKVNASRDSSIEILRSRSTAYSEPINKYRVYVNNTGDVVTRLHSATLQGQTVGLNPDQGNYVLTPGNVTGVNIYSPIGFTPFEVQTLQITTTDGAKDATVFANNTEGYRVSLLDDRRQVLPEVRAIDPNATLRDAIPVDLARSVAYTNGTVQFSIQNTGSYEVGVENVFIDQTPVKYSLSGSGFLQPGESVTIVTDAETTYATNQKLDVFVTAIGANGLRVASDGGILSVIDPAPSLKLLPRTGSDREYATYALANESVSYTVKNTGNVPLSLANFQLNGTLVQINASQPGTAGYYAHGDSTLGLQEVAVFRASVEGLYKLNASSPVQLSVTSLAPQATQSPAVAVNAELALPGDQQYITAFANATATDDVINVGVRIQSDIPLRVDGIYVNDTWASPALFTLMNGSAITNWTIPAPQLALFTVKMTYWADLVTGDTLRVRVVTAEGPEDSKTFTVT